MTEWYSKRFDCIVDLTKHALERMIERHIDHEVVQELIELGDIKLKDKYRFWIYKEFENRDDNLICAAVVLENKMIIKTIMHHWEIMEVEYEN